MPKTAPQKPKRKGSGANPLSGTLESVPGYPTKLRIFRVESSPYYWARVYINGAYKVRTLKTEVRKDALNAAKRFYEDCLVGIRTGTGKAPRGRTFAVVGRAFIDSLKGIGKDRRYNDDRLRFEKELLPFFSETDVAQITNARIGDLIQKLYSQNLSVATVNHYIIVLRKILKYASDNQLIQSVPNFPKIPGKSKAITKRDYFEQTEYERLVEAAEKLANDKVRVRGIQITEEIKYLIQFMVGSFLRPSDLRVLKHQHVKAMRNEKEPNPRYQDFLLLSHPATKTTDQEVVTMPSAYHVYQRLLQYQKSRGLAKKTDYLFMPEYPNRNTMMNILSRLFRKVVQTANISSQGEKHTLYSLRHSSIMYRLILGNVNTLELAKNARTSQAMIEKHYASRLTPVMAVQSIHSFKQ